MSGVSSGPQLLEIRELTQVRNSRSARRDVQPEALDSVGLFEGHCEAAVSLVGQWLSLLPKVARVTRPKDGGVCWRCFPEDPFLGESCGRRRVAH
jgi:hypothetical protein